MTGPLANRKEDMVDRDFTFLTINKKLNMKYHTMSAMDTEGGELNSSRRACRAPQSSTGARRRGREHPQLLVRLILEQKLLVMYFITLLFK